LLFNQKLRHEKDKNPSNLIFLINVLYEHGWGYKNSLKGEFKLYIDNENFMIYKNIIMH